LFIETLTSPFHQLTGVLLPIDQTVFCLVRAQRHA
jgi:hypothetical protein